MCTPAAGKDQRETKDTKLNALCILPRIQTPLRVEVLAQESNEQFKTWRIKLCSDQDKWTVKDEHCSVIQAFSYDLVVPGKCLVSPVSLLNTNADKSKLSKREIFNHYYYPGTIAKVNPTDIVAWAPPFRFSSSRTELIPCTLYYAGFDEQLQPSDPGYAFVCPLKSIAERVLAYRKHVVSNGKLEGWGQVFKVPINDIYRWEDISRTRLQLQTELHFLGVQSSPNIAWEKTVYTFVYQQNPGVAEARQKPAVMLKKVDLEKVVYPDLDIEVDKLWKDEKSLDGKSTIERNSEKSVVRETRQVQYYSEKRAGKTPEPAENKRNVTQNDPLLPRKEFSDLFKHDRYPQTPGGSMADPERHISKEKIPKVLKTNCSSVPRDMKRRPSIDMNMIILFGKCFGKEEKVESIIHEEIECGDTVVAAPQDKDNILGKVKLICKIPSIHQDQIFAQVVFEDKINVNPFIVRHIWKYEDKCQHHCRDGNHVFIPVELLLEHGDHPSAEKSLHLLRNFANADNKANKKIVSTGDVHVDFQYEAARRDFAGTPLELDKLAQGKLQDMGIQGNANSCYMDAALFALYSFTNNFDKGLVKMQTCNELNGDLKVMLEAARNLLKYDIVTPLRCAQKVDWTNVYKLRSALACILNDKSYLGSFMDAEHFITNLFARVLKISEFLEIGEDTREYVLQLFPPMTPDGQEPVNRPSVQYLLQEYCSGEDIKLRRMPHTGFLLKLPVCNGVRQYKVMYPNLELDLYNLLDKKDEVFSVMILSSVICLKKNHFTCFVRTISTVPTWFFHDSMAAQGESILTECKGLEEGLRFVAPIFNNPSEHVDSSSLSKGVLKWIDRLLSTAYICVYEPPYRSTAI